MAEEGITRRLAAILAADVVGYTRLMEADEDATLAAWWVARKEIIDPIIARHAGRIVKHTGDGFLAEFNTVLDAVQSAIAMQAELAAQNADVPGDRRLDFRMGINLGDIVVDDEDIYGDGVNIAARLEALAEPGGICVSAAVYNQVDNKLDVAFEDMGEQAVKNIVKAVRAYRVRPPRHARRTRGRARTHAARRWTWAAVAALAVAVMVGTAGYLGVFPLRPPTPRTDAGPALSLPDKPSIAVLPFTNMSGDPEQEYFSDGITEDIITDLSKSPALFVIARNSSFVYKERAVDVRRVGEELGVRYVLEGSVRKANDRVRITAQLVDAASGTHLWAERYDRDLKDIFAVQEEVAHEILSALVAKLKVAGPGARGRTLIENLEAYDLYLRGMEFYRRHTKEANAEARRLLAKAIELDPGFARAYSALGWTHFLDWALQWSHDPGSLDHALDLAQSAIGLNPFQANAYHLLSHVYLWRKQHEQAIAAAEKAIALDPGNADSYAELGEVLAWSGRPEETIELVRKAMRLDPHHPMYYSWNIGHAYRLTGRFEEAIEAQRNALARNPDFLPSHAELAVNYGELGREKEQRAAVAECLRISPDISLETLRARLPYKRAEDLERVLDGLRIEGGCRGDDPRTMNGDQRDARVRAMGHPAPMPGAGLVAASLALAGLAACGVASIYGEYFDHAYAPTELSAGAGEALYVEVIGVPPAAGEADAGEVGRFIVRALEEGAPGWLQTEFTTDAAEADDPDYRIRVIFDPPPGLTLIRACEETRSDARPVRDRPLPTVVMAICRHGRVFSAVEGSLGATASFDANRDEIARLLGFAAQVALPTRNPLSDEDCPTAVVCN